MTPLESADKVYLHEFIKGEIGGMEMILQAPDQLIDEINELVKVKKNLAGQEED